MFFNVIYFYIRNYIILDILFLFILVYDKLLINVIIDNILLSVNKYIKINVLILWNNEHVFLYHQNK